MSLIVTAKKASAVPLLSPGLYPAVCVGVADLGSQHNPKYNKSEDKVLVTWEVIGETVDVDGEQKPRWLSRKFTKSLNPKSSLAKALTAWLGIAIDTSTQLSLGDLIGTGCQLQVETYTGKDEREHNNVSVVVSFPKGMTVPAPISETTVFDIDAPDAKETLSKLPQWVQEEIKASTTWQKRIANTQDLDIDEADVQEAVAAAEAAKSSTSEVRPF